MITRCITRKGLIHRDKTTSFTRERRSPLLADGLEYFQVSLILFELRKRFVRTLAMGARSFGAIGLLISQGKDSSNGTKIAFCHNTLA